MSALADLLNPPQNASGASFNIEQRVKVITSTDSLPQGLETAISLWMIAQELLTDTFFGAPVYMGTTGAGGGLRFHAMIPYAYFVPPPS